MENLIKCYGYGDERYPIYELWIAEGDKCALDFLIYIPEEKFDEFKKVEKEFFEMQEYIGKMIEIQRENPIHE